MSTLAASQISAHLSTMEARVSGCVLMEEFIKEQMRHHGHHLHPTLPTDVSAPVVVLSDLLGGISDSLQRAESVDIDCQDDYEYFFSLSKKTERQLNSVYKIYSLLSEWENDSSIDFEEAVFNQARIFDDGYKIAHRPSSNISDSAYKLESVAIELDMLLCQKIDTIRQSLMMVQIANIVPIEEYSKSSITLAFSIYFSKERGDHGRKIA